MRFWIETTDADIEVGFLAAALRAGHVPSDTREHGDFFVLQSDTLAYPKSGRPHETARIGKHRAGPPGPRYEFQIFPEPVEVEGIGTVRTVHVPVRSDGTVESFGYMGEPELLDDFASFLLNVGTDSLDRTQRDPSIESVITAVEEFATRWNSWGGEVPLDSDDRRVAEALVALVTELVKVQAPDPKLLRSAFTWLAGKLDTFTHYAVKSAGTVVGAMLGVEVMPHGPQLIEAIAKVLGSLP